MPPLDRAAVADRLRAAGCVFAEDEAALLLAAGRLPDGVAALVERRVAGEPLEHLLGWAEFCGLRVAVEPGVFVPRRRSEFLVRQAAARLRRSASRPVVVDVCCGSGALALALAVAAGPVQLAAADVDPAAVRCARRNLAPHGGRVYQGDLFTPLPAALAGRVAVLLANVPYVPTAELPLLPAEARVHEPRTALDGGADGLDVLRRVAARAPGWLAPGGYLVTEVAEHQAAAAVDVVAGTGLRAERVTADDEPATVVVGVRGD